MTNGTNHLDLGWVNYKWDLGYLLSLSGLIIL